MHPEWLCIRWLWCRNNSINLSGLQCLFLIHDTYGLSYQLWVCSTCPLISEPMLKVSGAHWPCERKRIKELVETCNASSSFCLHEVYVTLNHISLPKAGHNIKVKISGVGIYPSHRQGMREESKYLLNPKALSKPIQLAGGAVSIFLSICTSKTDNDPTY